MRPPALRSHRSDLCLVRAILGPTSPLRSRALELRERTAKRQIIASRAVLDRSCRRNVDNVRSGGDEAVVKRLAGGSDEFPDELPHTLTGYEQATDQRAAPTVEMSARSDAARL